MDDFNNNDYIGGLMISEEVIAAIALNAAKDVEGVSGFANRPADVQTMFKIGADSLKSVRVITADSELKLHLYIKLYNNAKIPVVSTNVQRAVKTAVQSMTGRIVTRVNVNISGIDFTEPSEIQQ